MSGTNTCAGGMPANANFTPGSPTGNVEIPFGNAPKQSLINDIDAAVGTLGAGWKARITPQGGRNARPSGTDNHPNGDAADIQLYQNGKLVTPNQNPAAYQQVVRGFTGISNSKNIRPGIGGYDSFLHLDQSPWRQRDIKADPAGTWGAKGWASQGIQQGAADAKSGNVNYYENKSDGTSGEPPAPLDPAASGREGLTESEIAKQNQTNCTPSDSSGGGGGCGPVTASAPGVAASLLQNAGLQIPTSLTDLVSSAVNTVSGGALGAIQAAADTITSGLPGRDLLATIAPGVASTILSPGSTNKISGLLGAVAPSIAGQLGISNRFLGSAVGQVAGKLLSGNKLNFASTFGLAAAAVGSSLGLPPAMRQGVNLVFGNAGNILQAAGLANLGGYDNLSPGEMNGFITKGLVGPLDEVMLNLNDGGPMAQFGSLYPNYNAMTTQGYGALSRNLNGLGRDMRELGRLADMNDLFRIGTAGQIVSQIMLHGGGYETGLAYKLRDAGMDARSINTFEADEIAQDMLGEINDEASIQAAYRVLGISNREGISHLGELTDPQFLLPRSYEDNEFAQLRDMAPQLTMCGIGRIQTLAELGQLFDEMETVNGFTALNQLPQPTTAEELDLLQATVAPTSHYSGTGDLTIADFLGTAAGYGHSQTLPSIIANQDIVWSDPITNDLQSLLTLQADALAGTYTGGGFVTIPPTGGYAFGTYGTLDDAVIDIHQAIDMEMTYVNDNATGETAVALFDLQAAHEESVGQLWREEWLRQQHGIALSSDSKTVDRAYGDGSSVVFDITGPVSSSNQLDVYVAGVYKSKSNYSVNITNLTVTFTAAPASGALIEIVYSTGLIAVTSSKKDAWQFATQLENWGSETGFGKESDFISRIATDDVHGQRIKAVMIQGRNKARAEAYGINCNGANRLLSENTNSNPTGLIQYGEKTGIWSDDYVRAADLYLQVNDPIVQTRDVYYDKRIESMREFLMDNKDKITGEVLDNLLMIADDVLLLTDLGATAYDTIDIARGEVDINLYVDSTKQGFVLGPQDELITAILQQEGLKGKQQEYTVMPSKATLQYLKSVNMDIKRLTGAMQLAMITQLCKIYGLTLGDAKLIFGMPSVGKTLLYNATKLY
jgi:hypothetical protein